MGLLSKRAQHEDSLVEEIGLTGRCDLSSQGLTELPSEIAQLTKLKELTLDANRLTSLPSWIGQLTSLQILALIANELTALPPEIGKLTNLQELRLDGNRLTALPPEIGKLTNLQTLTLDVNELTALPPEITKLTSLQTLTLKSNQLTALPQGIGKLTNLQILTLDRNQLTALPPEISQLTNLRELWLDSNGLATLPPEIGRLTSLQTLALKSNQLTVLPRQLADLLTGGLILELDDNPIQEPIRELLERGTGALASYLSSLEDAIPQYEAKVLLVGEGNVGKTSLIAALRNDPFVEGRDTTHGIEIKALTLQHPDLDAEMTVRAWDFGGQEVYRITHQFFFSQGAIYLVVWKPREGQEQNEVEGWLRRIRLRVRQDARALVVATHCSGERHPDLDYPHLKRAFHELLAGQFDVDSCTEHGILKLRQTIAAEVAQLPQMGQLISPRWIAVRDEIAVRAETEPQIAYDQFVDICHRHDVKGGEVAALAELLHILGRIIYYGDDEGLRDFVVLNPEWLTKAISYVLEDEPTWQSDGILEHSRLKEIWQDRPAGQAYLARHHPYFLRLMEKFDVSYRLEDDEYRSLVAQLVPHDQPGLPWDSRTTPPDGIRRLALVCRLSEPVPGLMAWLTVRHHHAATGEYWRSGVFLRHPISAYSSEALLELRTADQLSVEVRAPSPDYFFNVIRGSIEDLMTRRWPGLTYQLLIPCPSVDVDGSSCPSLIPMKGLLAYREEGETHYRCMDCRTKHDLSVLLTGFTQPVPSLQPALDQLHSDLADVIHNEVTDVRNGIDDLKVYAADTAEVMRRTLRAVSTEITDCPRLFTLVPESPSGMQRVKIHQQRYRLVLWCEDPGHWHPWPTATYSITQPKEWLDRIAPYATLIFKALQLVTPIAAAVAGVALTADQLKHSQNEIQLMKTLIAELPDMKAQSQSGLIASESESQLTPAQDQAWRALRVLIFEHDRMRAFGGLRRMQAPSGEFLWICPNHYPDYDPGLPSIPAD